MNRARQPADGRRPFRPQGVALFLLGAVFCGAGGLFAADPPTDAPPRLLIAFATYKHRVQHPQVFFYEHDGRAGGRLLPGLPAVDKRSDHHPSLSLDGRYCAFASEQEGNPCIIKLFDRKEERFLEPPGLNDTPHAQAAPSLSGDGTLLLFEAWSRPSLPGRWDLVRYELGGMPRLGEIPAALNSSRFDERFPALSRDGRWLAYVTNDGGTGATDVAVVNAATGARLDLPGLNSSRADTEPCLSRDGRWLAFVSDRTGGAGLRDVYLYDTDAQRLVDLPGLNSPGQEQSPAISPDGRFLLFVSERFAGAGERDLYLYDREQGRLVPTPELNSPRDELDPELIELP